MVQLFEGCNGSINFFFEKKFIATLPLNKHLTYEKYIKNSDKIIVEGLQKGENLSTIKRKFWTAVHALKYEDKLSYQDSHFLGIAVLGLIKLKQIDADGDEEGILIMPPYSRKKR